MNCIIRLWLAGALGLAAMLHPTSPRADAGAAYAYPFDDPLVATVVGTPEAYAVDLPVIEEGREVDRLYVQVAPRRPVPEVFFLERHGIELGLLAQDGPAPLVFIIAGTGGSFDSATNLRLAALLWSAGYHVLALPNPTHPNFIVNASSTGVPGRLAEDAADLHNVMRVALERVAGRIEVTDIHLAGFSLGATYAAFVARHDRLAADRLDLTSVLLINPAVSLIGTIGIVDAMLDRFIERDPDAIRAFIDRAYRAFAQLYVAGQSTELAGDDLYRIYQALEPTDDDLEKLIGLAFRLSAVNLAFAADVISGSHYLVPEGRRLSDTSSLTDIYLKAQRRSFGDYVERLFLPFHLARDPAATRRSLIAGADLRAIEDYLVAADNVALLTNADDIILRPDDLSFLGRVFAGRSRIYPTGGHGGNLVQRDVALATTGYFAGAWPDRPVVPDAGQDAARNEMREGL